VRCEGWAAGIYLAGKSGYHSVESLIEDERIEAPLIVIGFPRSGTTLLHALLAAAPGNRAPLYWEIARPSPPPSLAAPGDPRIGAEGAPPEVVADQRERGKFA